MSLAQRAQASGSVLLEQRVAPPDLARLKSDVQRFVSVGDIAAMMSRQPRRARSELLGACRQAFQLPTWRAVPEGRLEELSASLVDEVFGFGPLEPLLADPTVTEIMVNGPQSVFFERGGCL